MSFKTNDCQQLSLDGSFMALTEREKITLEKSWAKIFADEIFPSIDEERFSVLYCDKASRPNAPVNVIIGVNNPGGFEPPVRSKRTTVPFLSEPPFRHH